MSTFWKRWLIGSAFLALYGGSCHAEDFKLIFFYQQGFDDDHVKVVDAKFDAQLDAAGPFDASIRFKSTAQPYKMSELVTCLESETQSTAFPEMPAPKTLVKYLKTLVLAEKRILAQPTQGERARELSTYLYQRWTLRREVIDSLVVCFRHRPAYKTKSISYPVFIVLLPSPVRAASTTEVLSDPEARAALSKPGNLTLTDLVGALAKSQRRLVDRSSGAFAAGLTISYDRSEVMKPADFAKFLLDRREAIILTPRLGEKQFESIESTAFLVLHELGHYLGIAHPNTYPQVLPSLGIRPSGSYKLDCAALLKIGAARDWKITDQDALMSGVNDTASLLNSTLGRINVADPKEKETICFDEQKRILISKGISPQGLASPEYNIMGYGVRHDAFFLDGNEWSRQQRDVASKSAHRLLDEAK